MHSSYSVGPETPSAVLFMYVLSQSIEPMLARHQDSLREFNNVRSERDRLWMAIRRRDKSRRADNINFLPGKAKGVHWFVVLRAVQS